MSGIQMRSFLDFIDGVSKEFMIREMETGKGGDSDPNCRQRCSDVWAKRYGGGVMDEGRIKFTKTEQ